MFVIYNMEASGNFAPAFGIGYEVCDLKFFFLFLKMSRCSTLLDIGSIMIYDGNI